MHYKFDANSVGLYEKMEKSKVKKLSSKNKKVKITMSEKKTIDLQGSKSLFARLLVIAKSQRDLNREDCFRNFDLTVCGPSSMGASS